MSHLDQTPLREYLKAGLYQGYAYSYPHKMAYRPFPSPVPLAPLWREEDRESLFFYLHLPFCEMRCGFCNLFTTTNPKEDLTRRYLATLDRQLEIMSGVLGQCRFGQAAFGGGTPSFLSCEELAGLFQSIRDHLGAFDPGTPLSFETSPGTVDQAKLAFLHEAGVTRLSIGVQSFVPEETRRLGRPQKPEIVHLALNSIAEAGFPVVNLDLIYGVEGQSARTWQRSLDQAMGYAPQELYLYPLYVRPLTGLGRKEKEASDLRLPLYRQARDFLLERGYEQISMRLFRHQSAPVVKGEGPLYCCQEDGMVGFGAGARSYTKSLHYSSEYAVGRSGIMQILEDFVCRPAESFRFADYGCQLGLEERKRRFVIKSLLRSAGLSAVQYRGEFGASVQTDFDEEIAQLVETEMAVAENGVLQLTRAGMEASDAIGPWLFSPRMKREMESFELV